PERAGNGPVEERGARGQVVVHPAGRGLPPGRHVDGQGVVRGGVTVVSGDPGEVQAVRRHPARGLRWAPVLHVSSLCHGTNSVGSYRTSDQWAVWTDSAAPCRWLRGAGRALGS